MFDKVILEFLENKKQDYLKKHIKANTSDEDKLKFTQEAEEKYSLTGWLTDASSRAKQLSLTSHPAKFVHPNAKVSSLIVEAAKDNDGLLRSGNVTVSLDVFGNAAALDVEKFLRIEFGDGKTLLQNFEEDSVDLKKLLEFQNIDYKEIKNVLCKLNTLI